MKSKMKGVVGNCKRCGSRYGYMTELDGILCKKCIKRVWEEGHEAGKW